MARLNLENSFLKDCTLTGATRIESPLRNSPSQGGPVTITTAGAATYTMAQILTGMILRDPNGAGRSDVLPTAALLVASLPDAKVGDTISFSLVNTADAAEAITVTAGTGGTMLGIAAGQTVPQNQAREVYMRVTAVGTPTYDAWVV